MNPQSNGPNVLGFRQRALGALALIALAIVVVACGARPAAPKRTYLLDPAAPPAAATAKPLAVRVGVVNVAAPFRNKSFVYRESDLKFESDFYDEFFIAPTAMLSEATARALASAKVFRRVIAPSAAASDDSDYALDGFVTELYGDAREGPKMVAVLTITFYLSSSITAVPNVLWSREYRQRVAATDPGPEALARAWNTALSSILADLVRDLATVELPLAEQRPQSVR